MLAGIKTGKKKKKRGLKDPPPSSSVVSTSLSSSLSLQVPGGSAAGGGYGGGSNNESVAEQLRRSLAQGGGGGGGAMPSSLSTTSEAAPAGARSSRFRRRGNDDDLERRGRIKEAATTATMRYNELAESNTLVLAPTTLTTASAAATVSAENELTVQEMVAKERSTKSSGAMTIQETVARNIIRAGKRKRRGGGGRQKGSMDSDAEEEEQLRMFQNSSSSNDAGKQERRELHRQVAAQDRQSQITSKCWWWFESNRFERHRLIALGNFVSLVMAPPNLSLVPGKHFYIVPIPATESLAGGDQQVWEEVVKFQSSLRALFREQENNNEGVVFWETVLPNKQQFWQTKLEAVAVPRGSYQDAQLHFKSALTEQAEEWGTHQKLLKTTAHKPLYRTVPDKFSYFYVEYDDEPTSGYAQLIESSDFPKDFGVDTVAGMMGLDPLRFRRKEKNRQVPKEQERRMILQFLEKWKEFDWTLELDA